MICIRCHQDKPLSEFPPAYLANYQYWCWECKREYQRVWKQNHPEYANRNRGKRYNQKDNPERDKAHIIVYRAIKQGILHKPNECPLCGKTAKLIAHHDDWSKPLEVRWLCRHCHGILHAKYV